MSSNTYGGFFVLAVFVIIGGLFVRQWRRADVGFDEGRGEVRYQRPVLVRVRRLPDPTFHDLKAGFWSLVLTVRGGVISIRLPQLPRRLAATLSLGAPRGVCRGGARQPLRGCGDARRGTAGGATAGCRGSTFVLGC